MSKRNREIISIKVNKLYGFLNHSIELRENGSTIIYGPNGSGKTTFLRIIHALFNSNFEDLFNYEFESIVIGYTDDKFFTLEKVPTDELLPFQDLALGSIKNSEISEILMRRSSLSIKYVFQIGKGNEIEKNKKFFHYEVVDFLKKTSSWVERSFQIERYKYSDNDDENNKLKENRKKEFYEIMNDFVNPYDFYFIDINRTINLELLKELDRGTVDFLKNEKKKSNFSDVFKIKDYAKELSDIIKYAVAKSEETTKDSNKSFPERIIESIRSKKKIIINELDIRSKYKETQVEIDRIINIGLPFRENNISIPEDDKGLEQSELMVLSIYLVDLNKKIELYKEIVNKIEVFLEVVGSKIRNKTMHINMDKGFYFRSKFTDPKEDLKLEQLSSGEQHQISLFYQLIFSANNATFFLIDEPEISLHVDWQRSFLDGLQMISKIRNHRFLIATHSPQIINGQLSLCEAMDIGESDQGDFDE